MRIFLTVATKDLQPKQIRAPSEDADEMGPSINVHKNELSSLLGWYGKAELPHSIETSDAIIEARNRLVAALDNIANLPADNVEIALIKLKALKLEIESELDPQNSKSLTRCLRNVDHLMLFMRAG